MNEKKKPRNLFMEKNKLFRTKQENSQKKTSQRVALGLTGGEFRAKRKEAKQLKTKFINLLMRNGEKSKAYKLFELSLNGLQSKEKEVKNEKSVESNYSQQGLPEKKDENKKYPLKERKGRDTKINSIEKTTTLKEKKLFFLKKERNDSLKNSILYQAVENVKPTLELRRVKRGGTTYQVPAIVNQKRQSRLAIKWIIESAEKRKRKNKTSFSNCLVKEIVEAFNKTGQPRQKRDEQLKIAEYNRAYTRYRWW